MYRVIIVDDEHIIRQGLRVVVDWESCGFTIIDEADDGRIAMEKILEKSPELILLDIKMPEFDGVTLLSILRGKGYKGRIIFLTGFLEIEYAQKAIALGADAYLTKPIDEVELYQFLVEIKKKLDQDQLVSRQLEKQKYRRLLFGQKIPPLEGLTEQDTYTVAEVQFDENFHLTFDFFDHYQMVYANINCLFVDRNWVLIFKNTSVSRIKVALSDLSAEIKHLFKSDFFIGVGREVQGYLNIYQSFQDAKQIGQQFFLEHKSKTVFYRVEIAEDQGYFYIDNDLLYQYVEVANMSGIESFFTTLEEDIRSRNMDWVKLKLLIANSFLEVYERIMQNYGASIHLDTDKNEIAELILSEKKITPSLQRFKEKMLEVVALIHDGSKSSNMKRLIDYIAHNYEKDLKLERLATIFSYNSSYLGTLFKQTTGKSFNTYLDVLRIEEAKKMLISQQYKVYEIAHLVGYSSVDYFYSKFKKYVDMSPKQFQQQNLTIKQGG